MFIIVKFDIMHTKNIQINHSALVSEIKKLGPTGDRTQDLRFTRPTPYRLATEPAVRFASVRLDYYKGHFALERYGAMAVLNIAANQK